MADVPGKFYRATKVRTGVAPSSAGSIEGEVLPPVNPPGSSLNSVGLTMPSAFTVSNSPLTANGTIGVAGAGTVAQYIRGDGSLADFPESSGGGSSVSYYLNGSVDQGTIGGIAYKELSKVPILGAGTDFTINADGYIASFITDAGDPSLLEIPGGNWNFETYFSASSSGGTPTFYVELYKVSGTTATLIASSSSAPELIAFGTNLTPYFSTLAVPTTTLALTDRLAVRYYVTHSGRTITLHTENNHLCQIITTFTTGLTALNGLTAQVQNFAVGTTGTDFNIASATATHTFNLPTASATNRGALSSADWSLFTQAYNDKINSAAVTGTTTKTLTLTQQDGGTITASWSDLNTDAVLSVFGRTGAVVAANGDYTTAQVTESSNLYYTDARSRAALSFAAGSGAYNTSTGVITIPTNNNQITNGAGYITSAALSGYVQGSGSAGQVAYWSSGSAITGESELFWDTTNNRLGIGITPTATLQVRGPNALGAFFNAQNEGAAGALFERIGNTFPFNLYTFSNGNMLIGGSVTATSIIRSGGTSSQYLMADGSVSTLTNPVTGTGTTNYLPKFTGSTTIGNSNIISNASGKFSLGTTATHGNATFEQTTGESGLVVNSSIAESPTIYLRDAGGAGYSTILANNNLYINASRVGIGIVTPNSNSKLHVYRGGGSYDTIVADGDSGTNTGFAIYEGGSPRYALYSNGASGNDSFNIYNFGAAANSFTIYTSGNVGINSSSDNGARLQVSGTSTFSGLLSVMSHFAIYSDSEFMGALGFNRNPATGGIYNNSRAAFQLQNNLGTFQFKAFSSAGADLGTPLTIASTGAATFSSTLQTGGDISLMNPSGDIHIRMKDSGGNADRVLLRQATTNDVYVGDIDSNNGKLILRTNGNDSVTIASSGAVQISNISGSGNRIVIANSSNTLISAVIGSGLAFDGTTLTATGGGSGSISGSGTSGTVALFTGATSIGNSVITQSSGNVLIGTGTAAARLTVVGAASVIGQTNVSARFSDDNNSTLLISHPASTSNTATITGNINLGFATGSSGSITEKVRILANGNVLIGTQTDNGAKFRIFGPNGLGTFFHAQNDGATGAVFERIGNTFPFNQYTFANGNVLVGGSVTATSFFESSDASLKTLIADKYQAKGIDSVVAKLYIKNGKKELGYFAQDLQGVLPSAVSKGSDGLLNLSYREVHTAKIAYLEEEIRQIKKRYEIN